MVDTLTDMLRKPRSGPLMRLKRWYFGLIADPDLQARAARNLFLRPFVRRDDRAIFDLMSGFVYSQTLLAAVEIDLLNQLDEEPRDVAALRGLPTDGMLRLCNSAAALGLIQRISDGKYAIARLGVLVRSVPGLSDMIRHHSVLYRDLSDPVALLSGDAETEMSNFWPYVFGATEGSISRGDAQRYSQLMSDTQRLVSQETLRVIDLRRAKAVLDLGGGHGTFLGYLKDAHPNLRCGVFDLAHVVAGAPRSLTRHAGNFREDALPEGYDVICLIRILFDHQDETLIPLLRKIHDALPASGRLIISEPMRGARAPTRTGDSYYSFYCHAMGTGKARSPDEIVKLLKAAGFAHIKLHRERAPSVTRVLEAVK